MPTPVEMQKDSTDWSVGHLHIVFKGPVAWTGKKTELDRTATEKDRFVSNWLQPVATGL